MLQQAQGIVAASLTPHPDFPLNAENLSLSLKGRGENTAADPDKV
jgi:hypothetical protein